MAPETAAPLVSVAVVTYNQHDFLEHCLQSILAQDYQNFEIVVADDGSTDGTADVLRSYATTYAGKIIPLISETNRGVTPNHDLALSGCRGEYISWIGGDDLMLPGKLSAQVAYLEANPQCVICYHDIELFDSESGETLCRYSDFDAPRKGDFSTIIRDGHFHAAISSMVRASHSPKAFNRSIAVASDWLYYVECLANGGTIEPIPGIYARQRRHPRDIKRNVTGSVDRSQPVELMREHLQSCEIILARWPNMARQARYRMSRLLLLQRWQDGGAHYRAYLRASLQKRFAPSVLAALLAELLFKKRY
jgi:glycosyltransferase involved in cell wall biosynthesis